MTASRARTFRLVAAVPAVFLTTTGVFAQGAARDLSAFAGAGNTFTVTLTLDIPGGTNAVGIEDAPPPGWVASAISDGGSWDTENLRVKWLFLTEPYPAGVTYDVSPAPDAVGNLCFSGFISFDGPSVEIGGDDCLAVNVPAASTLGLAAFSAGLLIAGTIVARRRTRDPGLRKSR